MNKKLRILYLIALALLYSCDENKTIVTMKNPEPEIKEEDHGTFLDKDLKYMNTEVLALYCEPSIISDWEYSFIPGYEVRILEERTGNSFADSWYRISIDGKNGWSPGKSLGPFDNNKYINRRIFEFNKSHNTKYRKQDLLLSSIDAESLDFYPERLGIFLQERVDLLNDTNSILQRFGPPIRYEESYFNDQYEPGVTSYEFENMELKYLVSYDKTTQFIWIAEVRNSPACDYLFEEMGTKREEIVKHFGEPNKIDSDYMLYMSDSISMEIFFDDKTIKNVILEIAIP